MIIVYIVCRMSRVQYNQLNTKQFIERSVEKWGNIYDYSKAEYFNSNHKILISCKIHGEFQQLPSNHLKYGCGSCGRATNIRNRMLKQKCSFEFVNKANSVHTYRYDYSKTMYTNAASKVIVTCKDHGDFSITPNNHLRGKGCRHCGIKKSGIAKLKGLDEYLQLFRGVFGDTYDYSSITWKGASTRIDVVCRKHGKFSILPYVHILGRGCPKCSNRHSSVSIQWLEFMQVKYGTTISHAQNEGEFIIPGTRYKADGYSKHLNIIFEFHGDYWHGNPKVYDKNKLNMRVGVSYGDLYEQTIAKTKRIKDLGFRVVEIWETEWRHFLRSIRILQKLWKSKSNEDTSCSLGNN